MSVINASPLLAAAGGDYQIQRSVRLRSSASAYFSRTPSATGSRQIFTYSGWVKRGALGTGAANRRALFSSGNTASPNNGLVLRFFDDQLSVSATGGTTAALYTSAVYRDPSAHYHVVMAVDTTQATASNRIRLYVNGAQVSSFATAIYPSQNQNYDINTSSFTSYVGVENDGGVLSYYFDGYLAEINFIDGQALTPSSFGETDTLTGAWKPKRYAGTYGTNGFYLNFADNSAATAAAIGKDSSGNGNNWTPTSVSVTAGTTYDSMLDVPTLWADGGNGRGNYAVLNPLSKGTSQTSVIDGNLYAIPTAGASNWGTVFSSIAIPTSGKWYVEALANVYAGSGNSSSFGVVDSASFVPTSSTPLYTYTTGQGFDGILCHLFSDYVSPISHGVQGTNVTGQTASQIALMLAIDCDNGKIYAGYNGTWLNSGNPAAGTGFISSRTMSSTDVIAGHTSTSGTGNDQSQWFNFGQRPFTYTPPTGFKALHTGILPEPTIRRPNQWMDISLYTGNGASQSIVNSGAFQPDLVWAKSRSSSSYSHRLFDSSRGVNLSLQSNTTNGDTSEANSLTAFNSNGFSLGADAAGGGVNTNAVTYVGWQWKKGATPGFDIVTYTGNATARTIAHSLGVPPAMIICKSRGSAQSWQVYHSAVGATRALYLNLTNAQSAASALYWNNTAPTSSVFSLGTDAGGNDNAQPFVAYLFADVPGFSRFGSYTGNGSSDGPFVFCGFRPRWVMVKRTDATGNWVVWDTARVTYNVNDTVLYPNLSNADDTNASQVGADVLSNGFKLRGINGSLNISGGTYIFAAFAENPFKYALAR